MPKQIGWSNESNLLYQISQQITRLINVTGTSGGSITGSGTANYITRWTSASSIGNSLIYDNGTSVGIGTTSPSATFKLVVAGNINIQGGTTINSDSGSVGFYDAVGTTQTGGISFNKYVGTYIYNSLNLPLKFGVNNAEAMRIDSSGNIGIGTTTPSQKLDVNGNVNIGQLLVVSSDIYTSRILTNAILPNTLTYVPFYSNVSPYGEIMRITNDGKILINRTTDDGTGAKLQVNGMSTLYNAYIGNVFGLDILASFSHISRSTTTSYSFISVDTGATFINSTNAQNIEFRYNNNTNLTILSSGNVNIGSSTSLRKLTVNGEQEWTNITYGTGVHTTSGNHLPIWVNGTKYWLALLNPVV